MLKFLYNYHIYEGRLYWLQQFEMLPLVPDFLSVQFLNTLGKTVKENTRLAIEEAIKELDFHPNNIAKGLRNAKSFSVAILLPMLDSTFCTSMISSIESTLLPLGYSVIVCECHNQCRNGIAKNSVSN